MARDIRLLPMIAVALTLCVLLREASANGAGRAFPIVSENYIIEKFQTVNRRLEWDRTNFLVDLSGQYANCALIGSRGETRVSQKTPDGEGIVAYLDYTDGGNSDVNSVNGYLRRVIDRWMFERRLDAYIREAKIFGCSVRPGCDSRVAVSCLFSPAGSGGGYIPDSPSPIVEHTAQAFTPEQYRLAEDITGVKWDRSHFLENLSGYETRCEMMDTSTWEFREVESIAKSLGRRFEGRVSYAPNRGSTPDALRALLPKIRRGYGVKGVGCSLIPDCIRRNEMYVVVSCIYEV